jgi:hypothetical protein
VGDVEEPHRHPLTTNRAQKAQSPDGARRPTVRQTARRPKAMIHKLRGALLAAAVGIAGVCGPLAGAAEPLVTQGIGTSSCTKLTADLKPADGVANPFNLLLYAWVQGYVSAANIALLEHAGKHLDMATLDDRKVLDVVLAFCKANPDAKPVTAIDELIRKTAKIEGKWEPGTVAWDE